MYSWGVLHHTGDMWSALDLAEQRVAPGGRLWVAIYNDQGMASRMWRRVKRRYVTAGDAGKKVIELGARAYFMLRTVPGRVYMMFKLRRASAAPRARGMDAQRDLVDWVGGYPFEVAKPEQIFDFYRDRGFTLTRLLTCAGGLGCNEFVFQRSY